MKTRKGITRKNVESDTKTLAHWKPKRILNRRIKGVAWTQTVQSIKPFKRTKEKKMAMLVVKSV